MDWGVYLERRENTDHVLKRPLTEEKRELRKVARKEYAKLIHQGALVRPDACPKCGAKGHVHGHHQDYSKPGEVQWLCAKCHGEQHSDPLWDGIRGRTFLCPKCEAPMKFKKFGRYFWGCTRYPECKGKRTALGVVWFYDHPDDSLKMAKSIAFKVIKVAYKVHRFDDLAVVYRHIMDLLLWPTFPPRDFWRYCNSETCSFIVSECLKKMKSEPASEYQWERFWSAFKEPPPPLTHRETEDLNELVFSQPWESLV